MSISEAQIISYVRENPINARLLDVLPRPLLQRFSVPVVFHCCLHPRRQRIATTLAYNSATSEIESRLRRYVECLEGSQGQDWGGDEQSLILSLGTVAFLRKGRLRAHPHVATEAVAAKTVR
ncbi:hypothetical protein QEZ47_01800 [Aminobacter anthyllidis]|uniref:hypothetical protein n=1 Tax=Aminobacter anthyllidis TaxID=1035067 RepID=UPI0024583896|nr:hypothetical protein [Aminobacter anthyllidis]MDH4984319.1 hypothetical protein [Aminobacter anthyllidis]